MNLITMSSTQDTMSSKEIAELTGKDHKNVLQDIRNVLEQAGIDAAKFQAVYKDQQLIDRPCFNLPRRECDLVISGYSVPYRLRIIDRWRELEAKTQKPMSVMEMVIASATQLMAIEAEQERQALAIKSLEAKQAGIGSNYGFYSIAGYANLQGRKVTLPEAAQLGKAASLLSKKYGIQIGKVADPRFGQVGVYHEDVLQEIFENE